MSQKPLSPQQQNQHGPVRPQAPHVQAALGAVQAKPAVVGRQAASHVQAAVGRCMPPSTAPAAVQPKPAAPRTPAGHAPHVAQAMAAAQAKPAARAPLAARQMVRHVQTANGGNLPPRPAAPAAPVLIQPKLAGALPRTAELPSVSSTAGSVAQCGKPKAVVKASKEKKFRAVRKEVRNSKNKLRHKRYPTAYGAFNKARKPRQQGPHTTAHIATSSALEVARKGGTPFTVLVNSAIVPRPRQVNRYVREELREEGRFKQEKKRVKKFVEQYQTLYTQAVDDDDELAIEKLIEKNPVATYGWGKGKVTRKQISGKGERRTFAIDDFESYREGASIEDLRTVDTTSGFSAATEHRYDQLSRLAYGHDAFSEDDGSSESDSDMDLD